MAYGYNKYGQLGFNDTKDRSLPEIIPFDKKIIQVDTGTYHTLILTEDYEVYSCGKNEYGELGLNHSKRKSTFQRIEALKGKKIIQIAAGATHCCALTDDGFVYSWGLNNSGQLGHGRRISKSVPTLINRLSKIKKIYCEEGRNIAIDDTIYVWGCNEIGDLGLKHTYEQLKPIMHPFFKKRKIKKISLGRYHTLALLENGKVYSWGCNYYGQLGHGDRENRYKPTLISFFKNMDVIDVYAIFDHSFAILKNNDIYAFGYNSNCQLSIEDSICEIIPKKIEKFANIVKIGGGRCHTLFVTESGKIYEVGERINGMQFSCTPTLILNFDESED